MDQDSESENSNDLLFFDTFAHETDQEYNLDLVQFPNPIAIREIRVIPLGAKVEADFPGGVRLGATNPSSFAVDFFINDLGKTSLSTFSNFGRFEYKQNVNIQFIPEERRPTDGLLIRGYFRTITLAIFGVLTDVKEIITKEESPSTLESADTAVSSKVSITSENTPPQPPPSTEPCFANEHMSSEVLQPLLTKLASALASQNNAKKIPLDSTSKFIGESRNKDRKNLPTERKPIEINQSECEKLTPFSRKRRVFSPVRSPISTPSESSMRSESYNVKSSFNKQDIPASPCSSHSPRSPSKYIHSRSHSPWYRNQASDLTYSPHRRRTPSPSIQNLRSSKTVSYLEPHKWKRRKFSPSSPPLDYPPIAFSENKLVDDEKSNCHSETISPVNKDLLEEISPEQSASDWENISEDENLEDISSLDGVASGPLDHESETFESISSEEEYFEEGVHNEEDRLSHFSDNDLSDYDPRWIFEPFHNEFSPITSSREPSQTAYQFLKNSKKYNLEKRAQLSSLIADKDCHGHKWVESIEEISKNIEFLELDQEKVGATVFAWLKDALNPELALKQTVIPFKVRQLKAGLKLAIALCTTDDDILRKFCDLTIPRVLLRLFESQNTSLPLNLLILRVFDALCDSVVGIEHLIYNIYSFKFNDSLGLDATCYRIFIKLLIKKPSSRIAIALESLLNKIHFYLLLKEFGEISHTCTNVPLLSSSLKKIASCFASMRETCTQRTRFLPISCFFEIKESTSECYHAFYRWAKHHKLINSVIFILKHPLIGPRLLNDVNSLLKVFCREESFVRFLLSPEIVPLTNEIIGLYIPSKFDAEAALHLSYSLQIHQFIEIIKSTISNTTNSLIDLCDEPSLCTTFYRLYTLTFTHTGRKCVARILSSSRNFDVILPFLTPTKDGKNDSRLFNSVCSSYAAELCILTVHLCEENVLHFLKTYRKEILSIAKLEGLEKLAQLVDRLSPLEEVELFDYSEKTLKELVSLLKVHAEAAKKLKENEVFMPPPQLLTVLQVLEALSILPVKIPESFSSVVQLKYHYAIIQVFSYDGLSSILTLLQKLAETFLRPSHQSSALVGSKGTYVISCVKPSILLVKKTLISLIAARGKDFCDLSPISVLLKIYSVMYLFPSTSFSYSSSQEVVREIVETLMLYTNPSLTVTEADPEAINRSVWSRMVKEVLDYTFSQPMTFIHGLNLLSEILPLPLPFQTLTPLSESEVNKMVTLRKLWSVHLLGLSIDLEKLITSFVLCSSPIIQQLLRRVCVQISDLSSPAATVVVRSVLEALLESLPKDPTNSIASSIVYVLNLLSFLGTHPPFKMAFIHTMHIGGKLDEKYFTVVGKLLKFLQPNAIKPIDKQVNHLILSFLISLCDSKIFLSSKSALPPVPFVQVLSNSLPPFESLKLIISSLLEFLDQSKFTFTNSKSKTKASDTETSFHLTFISDILRLFSLLCEHDYGFLTLKQAVFDGSTSAIQSVLPQLCDSLKTHVRTLPELDSLILNYVEFIKLFLLETCNRSSKLNAAEISSFLKLESVKEELVIELEITKQSQEPLEESQDHKEKQVKVNIGEKKHSLLLLNEYLMQASATSEELMSAHSTLEIIISLLNSSPPECDEPISIDIHLPTIEPLLLQFSKRDAFILTNDIDHEKLSPDYWFSIPKFYESERFLQLDDHNRINLVKICEKYISGGFDIRKELESILRRKESSDNLSSDRNDVRLNSDKIDILSTKDAKSTINLKKSFVAPMRGRGYMRQGSMIHSSRANDPFRSRPPNTSRPPSMHVDDFVALEQSGSNNFEPVNKRFKVDYPIKQRIGPNNSSSNRSFGSSTNVPSRSSPLSSSSYHSDRRHHQSPARGAVGSNRNTLQRFSRESFSPVNARRSGSIGPSASSQHWVKTNSSSRRDPRDLRDSRNIRQSINR